jgi:hypothetical protein
MKHHSDKFKCQGEINVPLWEREEHRKEPLDWLTIPYILNPKLDYIHCGMCRDQKSENTKVSRKSCNRMYFLIATKYVTT